MNFIYRSILFIFVALMASCALISDEENAGITNTGNTTKIYGHVRWDSSAVSLLRKAKATAAANGGSLELDSLPVYLSRDSVHALDSVLTDTSGYYEFVGMDTGTWVVKACYQGKCAYLSVEVADSKSQVRADLTFGDPSQGTLLDTRDGKIYRTVKIGSQTWMAENLNAGTYIERVIEMGTKNDLGNGVWYTNDSDSLVNQANDTLIEKYCYNDIESNCENGNGGLYQWAEAMALPFACASYDTTCITATDTNKRQGICPQGWHMPAMEEWQTLYTYLGGSELQGVSYHSESDSAAARKLKQNTTTGTGFWNTTSDDANASGFSALPAGIALTTSWAAPHPFGRDSAAGFLSTQESSLTGDLLAGQIKIVHLGTTFRCHTQIGKSSGVSVRCLQD